MASFADACERRTPRVVRDATASYIRSEDLGVDRDNVMYLDFEGGIKEQYRSFEQELRAEPGIVDVATSRDSTSFVINETAAASMGMEDPVGQGLSLWGTDGVIVGVVNDFHMNSLYDPIKPVIFRFDPERTDILYIRVAGGQTREAIAGLERIYAEFNPEYPLDYRFMDEEFEESYRSEVVIGSLANFFAVVAILIAWLTVSYQSIKVAMANPVEALRSE